MFEQSNNMYPGMVAPGYQYNGMPQQNVVKFNNTLSDEQIDRLMAKESQFSLGLTELEQLRGWCNHRKKDGTGDALTYDPVTGKARCAICGYEFRPLEPDASPDDIQDAVSKIIDILQTIKLMYIDLPADASREYFQIIPLLEKIPQFFVYAAKNMNKHDMNYWNYNNHNMGAINMLNNLQSIFGGMNAMQQNYQQPNMQQPVGYPTQPQPWGYPQANAFGYPGASQYVPGTQPNFAYQPSTTPTPVAPTVQAPAAPAASDATVAQTVTL